MQIDSSSYNKAAHYPQRHGYQSRGGVRPSSIVIHTTSNKRATQFETEASYLFKSADVSAHFLIGKGAQIVQFLDPTRWQAWHAGAALPDWVNAKSIGIEHHVSLGEAWTGAQHAACTWLVQFLMSAYGILPAWIETHRAVALPKGRKQDPAGWDDDVFYAWRAMLAAPPASRTVTAGPYGAIAQEDRRPGALAARYYPPGTPIVCDDLTSSYWHTVDQAGFIPVGQVQP